MDAANRRENIDLAEDLPKHGPQYSFRQALRLLRLVLRNRYGTELFDGVRVRPELSLDYQRSELRAVEDVDREEVRYRLTTTFLGLYGAGSPLPAFYTQEMFREQANYRAADREFIDVFNGVLYELLHQVWEKHSLFYRLVEAPDKRMWEYLLCLAGLGDEAHREGLGDARRQARYVAMATRAVRCAEGLRAIIADTIGEQRVAVEQCVPRMAEIPADQRLLLGHSGNSLGESTFLGHAVADRTSAFRVRLGPVESRDYNGYLPNSNAFAAIAEQIRYYLDQPFEWDLELACRTRGMTTLQLGVRNRSLLGWNTWVFSGTMPARTVSARFVAPAGADAARG
jgi:type VI secretion system protein ImpH